MNPIERQVRRIVDLLPRIARNLRIAALLENVRPSLTTSQLFTLLLLDEAPPEGTPTSRLAAELAVSLPTTTGLVDRLAGQGLVERRPHPADRRVVLVRLTPAGAEVIQRVFEVLVDLVTRVLSQMNEDERDRIAQAMDRVHELSRQIREEQRHLVSA